MSYKLHQSGKAATKLSTGETFPFSPGNKEYEEYLKWVALGNTATAADPLSAQALKDAEYSKQGITNDAKVEAMWLFLAFSDSTKMDALKGKQQTADSK